MARLLRVIGGLVALLGIARFGVWASGRVYTREVDLNLAVALTQVAVGLALWSNPWSQRVRRATLPRTLFSEPGALLDEFGQQLEYRLDDRIVTAFLVIERRVGARIRLAARLTWKPRLGIVAVTASEFVLFDLDDTAQPSAQPLARLARSTVLPPVAVHTNITPLAGGPLAFASSSKVKQWHYYGWWLQSGPVGYADIITDLQFDTYRRAGLPYPFAKNADELAAMPCCLEPDGFMRQVDELRHLVGGSMIAALPTRSTRTPNIAIRLLWVFSLPHSVIVNDNAPALIRHGSKSGFRKPHVVAVFDPASDLDEQLISHRLTIDRSIDWVRGLAAQDATPQQISLHHQLSG